MSLVAEVVGECNCCGGSKVKSCFEFEEFIGVDSGVEKVPFNLFICESCGLIFLNPQPHSELLGRHYSRSSKDPVTERRSLYRQRQAEFINSRLEGRGKAFDVGCFDGTFLSFLKKDGWEVGGCDLNINGVRIAKDKYAIPVMLADMEDADVKDNSRDLITFAHVVEHMPDPNTAFEWSRKKLSDEGHIYITVPDAGRMFPNSVYDFFTFAHLYYFSSVTMENYLVKHGFEIVDVAQDREFEFIELLARKSTKKEPVEYHNDYDDLSGILRSYSGKKEQGLKEFVSHFNSNKERWIKEGLKVLVWGGGLHTNMVYSLLDLDDGALDIVGIIDSSDSMRGKKLFGLTVCPPGELSRLNPDVVMVSSYFYAEEIAEQLGTDFGFDKEIFFFYGKPTRSHPIVRDY